MYFALRRRAALQPGETVLVPGAAGGVGTAVRTLAVEGRLLVIGFAAGGIPTVKVPHRRRRIYASFRSILSIETVNIAQSAMNVCLPFGLRALASGSLIQACG